MELISEVKSSESVETLRSRIEEFMEAAGYHKREGEGDLAFERGSRLGSLTAFTPRGWCAHSTIKIEPATSGEKAKVTIHLDVDTSTQIVTAKERAFWQEEIKDFAEAVLTGKYNLEDGPYSSRALLMQNIGLTVGVILLGMAGAFALIFFVVSTILVNTE